MSTSRKEMILNTATRLFAEKGFGETSTAEVAELAGVAQGTLFYHFKTKEGILLAVYETMIDAYVSGLEGAHSQADSGLEGLLSAVRFHFRFSKQRSQELRVLMRDFPSCILIPGSQNHKRIITQIERVLAIFRCCLECGIRDGSIRQMPLDTTVHVLRGFLNGMSRQHVIGPLKIPVPEEEVLDFCRKALAADLNHA